MVQIKEKDIVKGYGKVTRLSENSIYFGEKRYSLKSFLSKPIEVFYFESPDIDIDWTNEIQVDSYYKTFDQWSGVLRMGDSKPRELIEVKNNKVFYNGEYYLPYYSRHINQSEKKFLDDGFIFGYCVKMHNSFYSMQNANTVNVF